MVGNVGCRRGRAHRYLHCCAGPYYYIFITIGERASFGHDEFYPIERVEDCGEDKFVEFHCCKREVSVSIFCREKL